MRTTIELPDELFRKAKATAALRGMKLKDLIASFIERGLGQVDIGAEEPPKKRTLPASVRKATGRTVPSLTNVEVEEILAEEDARKTG